MRSIDFRALCQFLVEEGYDIPKAILKLKVLDTPQRLPRPLAIEQVRRLERGIQKVITEAKTEFEWMLAVRDLACFYLLWHCGLRISEVCSLRLNDIEMDARKLFIHNSKERKDRIAYMSDIAALAFFNSTLPYVLNRISYICSPPSMELCIRAVYKKPGLEQSRRDEILDIILANIE